MKSPLQGSPDPSHEMAFGYMLTLHFDVHFNFIGSCVEQIRVFPQTQTSWESECCRLIPYVRYEYIKVCKNNPEISRSTRSKIEQAQKKVKFFAAASANNGATLRIVKSTVVTQLHSKAKVKSIISIFYLEASFKSLMADAFALERTTREMPPELQEKKMGPSNKAPSGSKPKPKPRHPKK